MKKNWVTASIISLLVLMLAVFYFQNHGKQNPDKLIIKGSGIQRLSSPMAAVEEGGLLYIANSGKNQVSVFNLKGEFQFPIGRSGANEGELNFPSDVEVYNGKVYIADLQNQRIQVFTKSGQFLDYFPRERNIKPAAITIKADRIFVSDVYSQKIKIYSLTGKPEGEFSEGGNKKGQIYYANGVTVSDDGKTVFVADSQNQRIQRFTSRGVFEKVLPLKIKVGLPKGISYEKNSLYVTDSLAGKVYLVNMSSGAMVEIKSSSGWKNPADVSLTKNNVVITDTGKNQVVVLKKGGVGK